MCQLQKDISNLDPRIFRGSKVSAEWTLIPIGPCPSSWDCGWPSVQLPKVWLSGSGLDSRHPYGVKLNENYGWQCELPFDLNFPLRATPAVYDPESSARVFYVMSVGWQGDLSSDDRRLTRVGKINNSRLFLNIRSLGKVSRPWLDTERYTIRQSRNFKPSGYRELKESLNNLNS